MGIESTFRELFSETVTLYPPASVDKYGKRSWTASASVSACAHYMAEDALMRSSDGRDVVIKGKLLLYGNIAATNDYRCVLQDGSDAIIVAVDYPHDQNGIHHTVLSIGQG